MSRFKILLTSLVFFLSLALSSSSTFAYSIGTCQGSIEGVGITLPSYTDGMTHVVKFSTQGLNTSDKYYLKVKGEKVGRVVKDYLYDEQQSKTFKIDSDGDKGDGIVVSGNQIIWTISDRSALNTKNDDDHYVVLYVHQGGFLETNRLCEVGVYYSAGSNGRSCGSIKIWQGDEATDACYYPGCLERHKPVNFRVEGMTKNGQLFSGEVKTAIGQKLWGGALDLPHLPTTSPGVFEASFTPNEEDTYTLQFKEFGSTFNNCNRTIDIASGCNGSCNTNPNSDSEDSLPFSLCSQLEIGSNAYNECVKCATTDNSNDVEKANTDQAGVWTAIGCIKREPTSIVQSLVKLGLGIGGGVSLIMTLAGGFLITTSQGDPKRAEQAKEMITSAIVGLLVIIFSVTILQFIGFDILRIPGFGTS